MIPAILGRDLKLAFRAGGGAAPSVMFFALTAVLFSIAVGPDLGLLSRIAGPVLWTGALLATQISIDQIFRADWEDGSLDLIIETSDLLALTALEKALAHWLSTGAMLILATPVIGLLLNISPAALGPLMLALIIGTPALSLIATIAAALTVTLPRAGLLVSVIVGPLYVPTLIFGAGAVTAGAAGDPRFFTNLMMLAAVTLITAIISPLATAAALRSNLD